MTVGLGHVPWGLGKSRGAPACPVGLGHVPWGLGTSRGAPACPVGVQHVLWSSGMSSELRHVPRLDTSLWAQAHPMGLWRVPVGSGRSPRALAHPMGLKYAPMEPGDIPWTWTRPLGSSRSLWAPVSWCLAMLAVAATAEPAHVAGVLGRAGSPAAMVPEPSLGTGSSSPRCASRAVVPMPPTSPCACGLGPWTWSFFLPMCCCPVQTHPQ